MTVGEFIESHIVQQMDENTPIGYLAQHPLFEQVFRLRRFVYCTQLFLRFFNFAEYLSMLLQYQQYTHTCSK